MPVTLAACIVEVGIVRLLLGKPLDGPKVVYLEELFPTQYKLGSFAICANATKVPAQKRTILLIIFQVRWGFFSNELRHG